MQKLKKPVSILLVFMMIVSLFAIVPITASAEELMETISFRNEKEVRKISGMHFTITPHADGGIYADGFWEFDGDYSDDYAELTAVYGETITKLVFHIDTGYDNYPIVKAGENKIAGSQSGDLWTFDNVNASSVRISANPNYEAEGKQWWCFDVFELDVYYDASNAPAPSDIVQELIDAIGTVTLTNACKEKIDAARSAYDKLSQADQALVNNYKTLTDAEAAYQGLVDQAAADRAIAAINAIGTFESTPQYKVLFDRANNTYNGLTDAQKALVTNYDVLVAARTAAEELPYVSAGNFGGLYWAIDKDGVMTFAGSGETDMNAFRNNSSIRKVIINSSVTKLKSYTFGNCPNLTEVEFRNSSPKIDNFVFAGCGKLSKVTLAEGLTSIGYKMFNGCGALHELNLPRSVNYIEMEAFDGSGIQTLRIPYGLGHAVSALKGMGQLTTLMIDSDTSIAYTSGDFPDLGSVTNVYVPVGSTFKTQDSKKTVLAVKEQYLNDYSESDFAAAEELFNMSMYDYGNDPEYAFWEVGDYGYEKDKYEVKEVTVPGKNMTLTDGAQVSELFGAATIRTYTTAVSSVEALIDAIGTVELTDECKEKVDAARAAYEELSDVQKAFVTNETLDKLTAAETAIADLEAAQAVTDQINALPATVTVDDKATIEAARAAYEALTDGQKALVTNHDKLTAAETALAAAEKAAADKAAADAATDQINALPAADEITAADKAKIESARAAYEALTDDQKALVTNHDKLTAAETALAAAEKAAADDVTAQINALSADVTVNDKDQIEAARAAYDALTDDQKVLVTNLDKLTAAETALTEAIDQDAADAVTAQINALPAAVTAADKAKIESARAAYEALTDDQKALVTDLDKLTAAETALAAAENLFTGHSITLGGNIGVNFFINSKAADFAKAETAVVKFTCDGKAAGEVDLKGQTPDANGYYTATCDVVAAQMAHKIHAEVYLNDKMIGEEYYSVQDYAEELFKNPTEHDTKGRPDELKALAQALLNYGAMAQIVFDSALTEKPALANTTVGENGFKDVTEDDMQNAINAANPNQTATDLSTVGADIGAKFYTHSLIYLSKNTLRIYFTPAQGMTMSHPEAFDGCHKDQYHYYVDKADIAAAELDNLQAFTVGDTTCYFSALDYAKAVAFHSGMPEAQKNLAKALYLYNQKANAYFDAAPAPVENVVDLGTYEGDYEAKDGDVLSGTLGENYKITIADGATVTLRNANIAPNSSVKSAGITLLGDATIMLEGENIVNGGGNRSGILVPADKTLTIDGDGSLTASSGGGEYRYSCGIGGGYSMAAGNIVINGGTITATGGKYSAGIGSGALASCGTITINGGTIKAIGGEWAAGIGSSVGEANASTCGDINISGGTIEATGGQYGAGIGSGVAYSNVSSCGNIVISGGTIEATGGQWAAGIGSGLSYGNTSSCGNITIQNTVTKVTARPGENAYVIGSGFNGSTCGTVTVGGVEGFIESYPYTYEP